MSKKKINRPENFRVQGRSVIIDCSNPQIAQNVCNTWLRFIHAVPSDVMVEMIEASEGAPKNQQIDIKEYTPLLSCVKEIPHDDDYDYFRWRGLRFEAQCPKCEWNEPFPTNEVARFSLGMHLKIEHNKITQKNYKREWKQDWNCFKKNWR